MYYFCVRKKKYNHLSPKQRYTIEKMYKQGETITSIAKTIGVSKSTVSREIKRNKTEKRGVYNYQTAQMYADERKQWRKRKKKFTLRMKKYFIKLLVDFKWSPEQIQGRCKMEGIPMVGKTTMYNFLHQDKCTGGSLYLSCRHAMKYRKKRLATPHTKWGKRKPISERPQCIDNEDRMGDFEMDTIIGANQKGAILTITDRKTDFAIIELLESGKNAKELAKAVKKRLAFLKRRGQIHSITTDNGSEFAHFKSIERKLGIPVFFAKPYCSNDKPHIEHLNALIRQYLPKGVSFDNLSHKHIRQIENALNNRPRKKLGFRTPFEAFFLHLT